MRISVVLATYNSPLWLEKVLWGYAVQSRRADEIVIADDGCGFDPNVEHGPSSGMSLMPYRAAMIGGSSKGRSPDSTS